MAHMMRSVYSSSWSPLARPSGRRKGLPKRAVTSGRGRLRIFSVPHTAPGTIGTLVRVAMNATPGRPSISFPVRLRVPSGAMASGTPPFSTLMPDLSAS